MHVYYPSISHYVSLVIILGVSLVVPMYDHDQEVIGRIHRSTLVVTMVDQLVTLLSASRTSRYTCWAWVVHYV